MAVIYIWLPFWQKKINATDRDVAVPTEQLQITFPLNDKNIIY